MGFCSTDMDRECFATLSVVGGLLIGCNCAYDVVVMRLWEALC
jgi:hypothetical protein